MTMVLLVSSRTNQNVLNQSERQNRVKPKMVAEQIQLIKTAEWPKSTKTPEGPEQVKALRTGQSNRHQNTLNQSKLIWFGGELN